MNDDEGSGRGFSKKRSPYRYEKSDDFTYDPNGQNKTKLDKRLWKTESNDRSWSWSNLKNSILGTVQRGKLSEQIDHHFDLTNRQLNLPFLGPVSIF